MTKLSGVRVFGNHHDYEGDQPWWTLRFASNLSKTEKAKIAALLGASDAAIDGNFEPPKWESARQCQWETCDPWFSDPRAWQQFYAEVDSVFADLHQAFPLYAIFLQEGQFYDHKGPEENLAKLSDEQLAAL